jgi:hypothetical protein
MYVLKGANQKQFYTHVRWNMFEVKKQSSLQIHYIRSRSQEK